MREAARSRRDQEYRRLLYVALTRAEDRLYVCGWDTKAKRQEGCWYNLVARAMQVCGNEQETPQGLLWKHVGPQTSAPDNPQKSGPKEQLTVPLPSWTNTVPAPEPAPPKPLAPSRPEGEEPAVRSPLADEDVSRFQRGRLIHRLLQTLPDLAEQDRAEAATRKP